MTEWCATRTRDEVMGVLGGHVPVGKVNLVGDLINDPHVAARDMLVAVDQPSGRPVMLTNTPMRFTDTPAGIYRRAPMVDEHRSEIVAEAAGDNR